jgi:hypothetical protein
MNLVEDRSDVESNIRQLVAYLSSNDPLERQFGLELVQNGRCFVVWQEAGEVVFAPSRFIGYANNSKRVHIHHDAKDGKRTNPMISFILGGKPEASDKLDAAYRKYCEALGISIKRYNRKYWKAI